MKKLVISATAILFSFMLGIAPAAAGSSPWMAVDQAYTYAKANLGAGAAAYPTAIRCRLSGQVVQVQFITATGPKPFDKWWFVVARDPAPKFKAGYQVISTGAASNVQCALAYLRQ